MVEVVGNGVSGEREREHREEEEEGGEGERVWVNEPSS